MKKVIRTPYGTLILEEPSKEAIEWGIKSVLSSKSSLSEDDHMEGCDNGIRADC